MSGLEDRLRDHLGALDDLEVPSGEEVVAASALAGQRRATRHRQIAAVGVVVVLVGGGLWWGSRGDSSEVATTDDTPAVTTADPGPTTSIPVALSGGSSWAPIAADPRGPVLFPAAVWTGTETVTVAGLDRERNPVEGAAAYDPSTDSWRTIALPPRTFGANNPLVHWTGSEVVVLGGDDANGGPPAVAAVAYDPSTDQWRTTTPPPAGLISGRSPAVRTGTRILVWPEPDPTGESATPLSYDPATDSWEQLPTPPIGTRRQAASVWTGTEWIIWGGTNGEQELADGAAYNPTTDTWRTLAESPLLARRVAGVWTGTELIISAGASGGDRDTGNGEFALADGAAYDPATDTWRPIAAGFSHPAFVPIWTGHHMLLFAKGSVAVYDPDADQWVDSCCNETGGGVGGAPVWTGSTALLIGSLGPDAGGATFTPPPAPEPAGPHPAAELCVEFMTGATAVLPEGGPFPDSPDPETAQIIVFELPPPSAIIHVALLGNDAFFSCEIIAPTSSEPSVTSADGGPVDLTLRPAPDSLLVLDQGWSSRTDGGETGPGDTHAFGRAGQDVTSVQIELPDGTITPGEVRDGWFTAHTPIPAGVPLFGEQLTWTLRTGETRTARADTLTTPTTVGTPIRPPEPAPTPPTTSTGGLTPVQLPELGPDVWLLAAPETPDRVVRADPTTGAITEQLWQQAPELTGHTNRGHTLVCRDIDNNGTTEMVDLYYSFDGDLYDTYHETLEHDGTTLSDTTRPIDGTTVPQEINQICGHTTGPFIRLTALQLSALLKRAGFTDIAGDHAIDPTWAASGTWDGIEYWPLNLYQGDFRPESTTHELLECRIGLLEITRDLPTEARTRLIETADCED